MAIQPREKVEQKKQLTQRDDFLAVVAFAGAGGLYWAAGEYPSHAEALMPLSYVLGGIGIIIVISALLAKAKKSKDRKRKPR